MVDQLPTAHLITTFKCLTCFTGYTTSSFCQDCDTGYIKFPFGSTTCILKINNCALYNPTNTNQCIQCRGGYSLIDNKCDTCNIGKTILSNCQLCDETLGYINSTFDSNKCILKIPNCLDYL